MTEMRTVALTVALVLGVACASGTAGSPGAPPEPAPPPPLDPVGTYAFETSFEGQTISGKIFITGSPGAYGGSVEPEIGPPPVPITGVTVSGQEITLTADAGGEELTIVMVFTGKSYTGTWMLAFDSGELRGEKIEP